MSDRSLLIIFLITAMAYGCTNRAPVDETREKPGDSGMSFADCNTLFFQGIDRSVDTGTLKLMLRNGDSMSWRRFLKEEVMNEQVRWGLFNLDNDPADELIVFNNTGGAHCCDEVYVFEKSNDHFRQTAKLYGGFLCIDPATGVITFSFTETLGYFFGCYACGFKSSNDAFQTLREIDLKYVNGRFAVVPYNADVEKQLLQNLDILRRYGYEEIDEGVMDSGWRKEFAMNFAVWHYNHGQSWPATRKLFKEYYPFRDAPVVWEEFYATLREAERQNSF